MKKPKPTDKERVQHMILVASKIMRYTTYMTFESFRSSDLVADAVVKNFEIIGEAAYHITDTLKDKYPNIPWKQIQGLRHILVHDYYKINYEIVWNTLEKNLQTLKTALERIIKP